MYTLQKEVDTQGLGERWACTFTNFINAGEYMKQEKATEDQIDLIVGRCFRYGLAAMSNYVDHADLNKKAADVTDWNTQNPEWHYLCWKELRSKILLVVSEALDVVINPRNFRIGIMLTQYGSKHWVLMCASGQIINPDPSLKGEIIETRKFLYE